MRSRNARKRSPQVEALEGRIALSTVLAGSDYGMEYGQIHAGLARAGELGRDVNPGHEHTGFSGWNGTG